MGNVIVEFAPEKIIEAFGVNDPEDKKLLSDAIFYSGDWAKADLGEVTFEDICNKAIRVLPEHLHQVTRQIIANWTDILPPIEGTAELIRKLKEEGFKIYLLSNAAKNQPDYWIKTPGNEYFDGTVISALEKCGKPEEKFYRILLDRYDLRPEESLFIDDMERNLKTAERLGMKTFLFARDPEKLEEYISELKKG